MKEPKEDWIEGQCFIIEEGIATGNGKVAYQKVKTPTKTQQLKSSVKLDNSGNFLMEGTAVLRGWTEYCRDLYNYKLHPDTSFLLINHTWSRETKDLPVL